VHACIDSGVAAQEHAPKILDLNKKLYEKDTMSPMYKRRQSQNNITLSSSQQQSYRQNPNKPTLYDDGELDCNYTKFSKNKV